MVLLVIEGKKLDGFILGTKIYPKKFVSEEDGKKLNFAYEKWYATNELLSGWLYNSMIADIAS